MSVESLAYTIVPKSDQLNADDLIVGPITVKLLEIKETGDKKQPIAIEIDGGYKPWKPCLTMRRVMIGIWGANGMSWIGRSVTLYRDPTVTYGVDEVGGVRISHMSHIGDQPVRQLVTTKRGKRSEYVVIPLKADDTDAKAKDLLKAINGAEDMDELKGAYSEAVKFAKDAKNATLAVEFAAAKDARKAQLPQQPEQQ